MFNFPKSYQDALLQALYEHSPIGVCIIDHDHQVVACNAAMERINGRSLADGDRFHGPSEHPEIEAKVRQHVDIVLGLGEPELNVVVKGALRDGEGERRFLCDYLPLETRGQVRHVVALVREVERPIDGAAALAT